MRSYQPPLVEIDPLYKLGDVLRALEGIIEPVPTRNTIKEWMDEGILEGKKIGLGENYYVYKSSLDKFILQCQRPKKIAA